jgi:hypothetical protein
VDLHERSLRLPKSRLQEASSWPESCFQPFVLIAESINQPILEEYLCVISPLY